MTDLATITIDSIEFDKKGSIYFNGFVEGIEFEKLITSDTADFDKFIPKMEAEFECRDQDGLFNATLDSFKNLHWQLIVAGNIDNRSVNLTPIIEDFLLNAYQNTQ